MRKTAFVLTVIALAVFAAAPGFAIGNNANCNYAGYIVTIDAETHTFWIDSPEVAEAQVHLTGEWSVDLETRPPTLMVHISGTIATPDGTYEVDKLFVFDGEKNAKRQTWKQIISWVESIISAG